MYLGDLISAKGQHFSVVKSVEHPNHYAMNNDIGLVFLSDKVAGPYASFEGSSYPEAGSKLTVAGHGG